MGVIDTIYSSSVQVEQSAGVIDTIYSSSVQVEQRVRV